MACDAEISDFLNTFLQDFPAPLNPESPLPWRFSGATLSREELEGELAELAMGFLSSRNAPLPLAAALTHEAISQMLQADLSEFRKLPKQEEEEGKDNEEMKATVTLLDTTEVARSFFNQLWKVSSQWQKQVPVTARTPQKEWVVSIHAIRNARRRMEDRHVFLPAFNLLFGLSDSVDRAYFAVFDGHGGVDAARYAAVHVHVNAARQPKLLTDPAEALKEAFQHTDEMFLWKAKREEEWERIQRLGGFVTFLDCWRVNAALAVSRAIGDIFQKPYVSGDADSTSRELTGSEDYLLLACDGFFDFVHLDEIASLVHSHLVKQEGDGAHVAEELVAVARDRGSSDNITVMVVFLRDPRELLESGVQGPGNSQADVRSQDLSAGLSNPQTDTPQRN
ncbi:protein phosphatase 1F isoform X2 [Cavia porcellus]|uniref:protein phosphatase 1F isoform X2 n=1 Tax=Cavia porcellus TaxID=10141 RepID=UPI002FE0AA50